MNADESGRKVFDGVLAYGRHDDPITGTSGALLKADGSDPLGRRDAAVPPAVRIYMIAGTQHGGRPGLAADQGNCLYARNPHNPAPAAGNHVTLFGDCVNPEHQPGKTYVSLVSKVDVDADLVKARLLLPEDAVRRYPIPHVRPLHSPSTSFNRAGLRDRSADALRSNLPSRRAATVASVQPETWVTVCSTDIGNR